MFFFTHRERLLSICVSESSGTLIIPLTTLPMRWKILHISLGTCNQWSSGRLGLCNGDLIIHQIQHYTIFSAQIQAFQAVEGLFDTIMHVDHYT